MVSENIAASDVLRASAEVTRASPSKDEQLDKKENTPPPAKNISPPTQQKVSPPKFHDTTSTNSTVVAEESTSSGSGSGDAKVNNAASKIEHVTQKLAEVALQQERQVGKIDAPGFSRIQVRILRQTLGYFHNYISIEDPVPTSMSENELFKIFDERQYYSDTPSVRFTAYRRSLEHTDVQTVTSFMLQVLHQGVFSITTLIVCLIYMARLKRTTDIPIHKYTWRPLLMIALLIADKVFEDKPVKNKSLLKLFPIMKPVQFAFLEHTFVRNLGWNNMFVKPSSFERFCRELLSFKLEDWSSLKHVETSNYVDALTQEPPLIATATPTSCPTSFIHEFTLPVATSKMRDLSVPANINNYQQEVSNWRPQPQPAAAPPKPDDTPAAPEPEKEDVKVKEEIPDETTVKVEQADVVPRGSSAHATRQPPQSMHRRSLGMRTCPNPNVSTAPASRVNHSTNISSSTNSIQPQAMPVSRVVSTPNQGQQQPVAHPTPTVHTTSNLPPKITPARLQLNPPTRHSIGSVAQQRPAPQPAPQPTYATPKMSASPMPMRPTIGASPLGRAMPQQHGPVRATHIPMMNTTPVTSARVVTQPSASTFIRSPAVGTCPAPSGGTCGQRHRRTLLSPFVRGRSPAPNPNGPQPPRQGGGINFIRRMIPIGRNSSRSGSQPPPGAAQVRGHQNATIPPSHQPPRPTQGMSVRQAQPHRRSMGMRVPEGPGPRVM